MISWLNFPSKYNTSPFIRDIFCWKQSPSSFRALHVRQEANQMADHMAHIALDGDFHYNSPTNFDLWGRLLLSADASNIQYVRHS